MADEILTDHTGSTSDPAAPPPAPVSTPAETADTESTADAPPAGSLAEHEQQADQAREKDGRWKSGRHRAKSQLASPDEVGRIAQLTRRLRETEAERDALKTAPPASSTASGSPAASALHQPPAPVRPPAASSFQPVKDAKDDPEPSVDTFDDYSKWVQSHNRWAAREELREANQRQQQWQQQQQHQADQRRVYENFSKSVEAAKVKYPDFQQVAFSPTTPIPQGSLVDAWIFEHKSGADVLYELHKNPMELSRILSLPLLEQAEALTLLGQRLTTSPPSRVPAVGTGAAAAQVASPVPRPPTPVRTGPMRTGSEIPGDDSSLGDHEKYFFKGTGRR